MKKFNPSSPARTFREYLLITLGVIIYAFGIVGIIKPAGGVSGGASGLSLIIDYATGIPTSVSFFLINAVLLVLAVILLGAKFGVKTLYAIFLISGVMGVFEAVIPEGWVGLADDKFLSSVLGGALSGVGIGICLLQGGSTGGSDIVAMIVNKYYNISYSRGVVIVDVFIIGSSLFIFGDLATVIYGYVVVAVFGYTVDIVLEGDKQSLQIFVMSKQYDEIADLITNQLHRGATVLDGTGWYTKKPVKVLMIVCRKTEMSMMMKAIKSVDQEAFISMNSVMGVYGQGFDTYK